MAVEYMKLLAERPANQYTEPVVEKLATVTYNNGMYDEAAQAHRRMYDVVGSAEKRIEASTGYANSVLNRKDDEATMAMARDLDTLTDVDASVVRRCRFAKAKVFTSRNEAAEARKIYEQLSADVSTVEGAESAYIIIEMLFAEGKMEESEKQIYALADSRTPHAYWLGKAFILLGDIYVARNDAFQARATYRSVIDGYTPADDGIVAEAQAKLSKLN
jgi:predicted negative regulator of RcsB-dependent stress response